MPDLVEGLLDVDEEGAHIHVIVEGLKRVLEDAQNVVLRLLFVSKAALVFGEELLGGYPGAHADEDDALH